MSNPSNQGNQDLHSNTNIPVHSSNIDSTVNNSNQATGPGPVPAPVSQNISSNQVGKNTKNILLIEDDPVIIRMYSTKLTNSGYIVKEAANGEEAINILGSYKPDIVLLDLMLPKIDGFGFLQQANQQLAGIPVVILTNLSQDTDKTRAKELGAVDFLVKADITPQDVVNTIQKYI